MNGEGWSLIDNAKYNIEHLKLFIIVSLSFLLDGLLFSLLPLTLYIIDPNEASSIFSISLFAFAFGAILLGRIGDYIGRRKTMILSIVIYTISTIAFLLYHQGFIVLSIISSLINLGIGGEIGSAYSALAELMPKNIRGKIITLSTNMWNIGAALLAGLALIYSEIYTDLSTQINYLILSAIIAVLIVFFARVHMPESPRWLIIKGKQEEANDIASKITKENVKLQLIEDVGVGIKDAFSKYAFRLIILLVITSSQLLTYNMIAYYSPYAPGFVYGYSSIPYITFFANLGASLGAFILIPLIDKNRKISTTISYLGGSIIALLILTLYSNVSILYFLIAIFVNMIFSEFAWASLSTLESELFPTGIRSSTIGLITFFANFINALLIYFESYITAYDFILLAFLIWLIGLISAISWHIKGIESSKKSLNELIIKH